MIPLLLLSACGPAMPETGCFRDGRDQEHRRRVKSPRRRRGARRRGYETVEELAGALRYGTVDWLVIDSALARPGDEGAARAPGLDEAYSDGEWRRAFAKENADLTSAANEAIAALREQGTFDSIFGYYMTGKGSAPEEEEHEFEYTITMAADSSLYPWSYVDEDGSWAGIDVDCARAICSWLGVELEIADTPHDMLVDEVWYGRVQFAMGAMEKTDEALEKIDFSHSYVTSPQVIVVRK